MTELYRKIISQVSEIKIPEEEISDNMVLSDDLAFDSIAFVNMIVLLENSYGFTFDDEYISIEKLKTVKDVANYIKIKTNNR